MALRLTLTDNNHTGKKMYQTNTRYHEKMRKLLHMLEQHGVYRRTDMKTADGK